MLAITPPYLVIDDPRIGRVYSEIIYIRALMDNRAWLHVLTPDFFKTTLYAAVYVTSSGPVSGIFSAFAYEAADDKWLIKGLFEPTQDGTTLTTAADMPIAYAQCANNQPLMVAE